MEEDNLWSLPSSSQSREKNLVVTTELGPCDVVVGDWVKGTLNHQGNAAFRAKLESAVSSHMAGGPENKCIVHDIVDSVHDEEGRFLTPMDVWSVDSKQWELFRFEVACEQTSNAMSILNTKTTKSTGASAMFIILVGM